MSTSTYAGPVSVSPGDEMLDRKLFTPPKVAMASLLGGPLAGFLLIAANFKRLADASAAKGSVAAGIVGTALLWITAYLDPLQLASCKGIIATAVAAVVMYLVADVLQGPELKAHALAGGETASGWTAVEVAVLTAAAQLPVMLGITLLIG